MEWTIKINLKKSPDMTRLKTSRMLELENFPKYWVEEATNVNKNIESKKVQRHKRFWSNFPWSITWTIARWTLNCYAVELFPLWTNWRDLKQPAEILISLIRSNADTWARSNGNYKEGV